jgi:hypothetical protein
MMIYCTSAYPDPEPIESFLKLACHGKRHQLTERPAEADAILFVENSRYHEDAFFSYLRSHELVRRYRNRCFMYNEHDRPWYLLPGVYCSMPRRWFDHTRQRATRYIRLLNPMESEASDQPDLLFSFLGNPQVAVRKKIMQLRHPRALIEDTSSFAAFFQKEHGSQHQRYAEVMHRSKFVLCPRGSGTSSIRLFETLRAGRVPIILADQWVPPEGPDWRSCSVRVREKDVDRIPQIALTMEAVWPEMARAARVAWDEWFADEVLFDRIGDALQAIQREKKRPQAIGRHLVRIPEWEWRLRRYAHQARCGFQG